MVGESSVAREREHWSSLGTAQPLNWVAVDWPSYLCDDRVAIQIKAAISRDAHSPMSIETVELDDPRDDEILVRLEATGICHTDLTLKAVWAYETPMVFGHEGAGIVEAVGRQVESIRVGDRVVLSYRSCRRCAQCASGHPTYCSEFAALNASGTRSDGSTTMHQASGDVQASFFGQSSFASHAIANQDNVVVVDDVDPSVAAPLGCGVQTGAGTVLNVLRPWERSSMAIFGGGAVGLSAVMAAAVSGATTIVVDPVESRRELARELGAAVVIDPKTIDPVEAIREVTGGGSDFALDTTAIPAVIRQGVDALGKQGVLAVVGVGDPDVTISITELISGGKSIRGVIEGNATPQTFVPRLLEMHRRGELPVEKLIRRYAFEDIATACADTTNGSTIKPVLVF